MIATLTVLIAIAFVGASVLAFIAARVDVAASSTWPLGSFVISSPMAPRARGVQEEDLPRFVFKGEASPAV